MENDYEIAQILKEQYNKSMKLVTELGFYPHIDTFHDKLFDLDEFRFLVMDCVGAHYRKNPGFKNCLH